MKHQSINPTGMAYSQAYKVTNPTEFIFVSGQVPEAEDGSVPLDFRSQCKLVWKNVELQLLAAGCTLENLVKITVFLSDRKYREENYKVRNEILGKHQPAITIIVAGIYDEKWLLEIEAIAAC